MLAELKRKWKYRKTWGTPVGKDCVSLDDSLCTWLGTRLIFLSEHGYSGSVHMTKNQWDKELRKHGNALLRYKLQYLCDPEGAEEIIQHAQEALAWVAKHLPTLWD